MRTHLFYINRLSIFIIELPNTHQAAQVNVRLPEGPSEMGNFPIATMARLIYADLIKQKDCHECELCWSWTTKAWRCSR